MKSSTANYLSHFCFSTIIQLLWRSCGLICSEVASTTKANSPTAFLDRTLLNSIFTSQWLSYHLFTSLGANIQGKGINTKEVIQTWQTICDQYLIHMIETKWHHRPGHLSLRIKQHRISVKPRCQTVEKGKSGFCQTLCQSENTSHFGSSASETRMNEEEQVTCTLLGQELRERVVTHFWNTPQGTRVKEEILMLQHWLFFQKVWGNCQGLAPLPWKGWRRKERSCPDPEEPLLFLEASSFPSPSAQSNYDPFFTYFVKIVC